MKLGYMSSIHKKGDRRPCSNYTGIFVINPTINIWNTGKTSLRRGLCQFRRTMRFHNRKIVYRSHFHTETNPGEMPEKNLNKSE
jgi:hypothetical protein